MDYKTIYLNLISSRQKRTLPKEVYTEIHHILPKCLGGTDEPSNLIRLTFREHYVAHWLLTKIYKDSEKLLWAFSLMDGKLSPFGCRVLNKRQYERCKQANVKAAQLRWLTNNPMHNPEIAAKISKRMKGKGNPNKKYPERNRTAFPVTVVFSTGEEKWFSYGKKAAEELGIPYSTWKYASTNNKGIPSRGIVKIIKHYKSSEQVVTNSKK